MLVAKLCRLPRDYTVTCCVVVLAPSSRNSACGLGMQWYCQLHWNCDFVVQPGMALLALTSNAVSR